jgi:hypothetical protein
LWGRRGKEFLADKTTATTASIQVDRLALKSRKALELSQEPDADRVVPIHLAGSMTPAAAMLKVR